MKRSKRKKRYAGECRNCGKPVSTKIPVKPTKQIPPAARVYCSECRTTNHCKPEAKTEGV